MDDRNQSRVVFGGDEARPVFMSSQKKTSKMVQFVIAHTGGVIKNQSQAEKFLLVVMLVAIILDFFS